MKNKKLIIIGAIVVFVIMFFKLLSENLASM
ncbi:hypothetical protein Xsto_00024 [Xenorhabdus stockiae]|uniref:Uncharacterized protein n=1 Tax=Xenorhabdus stockiae TaxID=351614 RepID=A0A2D0KWP7_9GAMM|nr:hypothetical protein Xsto_00024 [Xenorhabdus stockiae]